MNFDPRRLLKWCVGGSCVRMNRGARDSEDDKVGGWSAWSQGSCASGCLVKSKGVLVSTRQCDNPKPSNSLLRCKGEDTKMTGCDDGDLCPAGRRTADEYASQQCALYSPLVDVIDPNGPGRQAAFSASESSIDRLIQ